MQSVRVTTLALVALLAVPVGLATPWAGKGQYEPDTSYDKTGVFMWQTAEESRLAGNRVYFNAYTQENTAYVTHGFDLGLNVAAVQMERQSWPGNLAALLGVWKDCNGDGYIGLGDQGLMEYRSELLVGPLDKGICPVVPGSSIPPTGAASYNWTLASSHNDGQWVREFIPIGPDANALNGACCADANPFDINDVEARVWGDWGTPGAPPPPTSCGIVFVPKYSLHSTGGLVYYADCMDGYVATDLADSVLVTAGAGGLSFADHPRDQYNSASPLNQPNPWGDPAGGSDVTVFDCGQSPIVPTRQINPTYGFGVWPPRSPTISTSGSVGGTVNQTASSMDDCRRDNNKGQWEDSLAQGVYGNEGRARPNSAGVRFQTDFPMSYLEGTRPLPFVGTTAYGRYGGVDSTRRVSTDGIWLSGTRIAEDRNPYLSRDTMFTQPIAGPQYTTTYASIGSGAIGLYGLVFPTSTVGTYGSEACGTATTGIVNHWNCDPAAWPDCNNVDGYQCSGTIAGNSNADITVRIGHSYQLRDVDCYDTSVIGARDVGVGWGTLTFQPNCS